MKCKFCTLEQKVAGNIQIFICNVCENMSECDPKYNIFICCGCMTKVVYPLNTSEKIKCSRCRVVNLVPTTVRRPNQNPNMNNNRQQGNNSYNNNPYNNNANYNPYNSNPYSNNPYNNNNNLYNNNNNPYNNQYNQPPRNQQYPNQSQNQFNQQQGNGSYGTYPNQGFNGSGYIPPNIQNNNPPPLSQGEVWENYEDFEKLEKLEQWNLKKLGMGLEEGELVFCE